jgi:hypothetical protein
MPVTIGEGLSFCGRELRPEELDLIRQTTRDFRALSLTELAHTLCELLGWRRPNGRLKSRECYLFLQALQERGWLPWLPRPQARKSQPPSAMPAELAALAVPPPDPLTGLLGDYRPLQLQLLHSRDERRQFQHYLEQHHYLGYRVPYGAQLRYFVRSRQAGSPLLACLLFTSAAWAMAPRDACIGWSVQARKLNLPQVVNNSRFLIPPWVRIPNLASHILSLVAHQLPGDWLGAYGVRPVLLETLVDPVRYHGGCYRAANWILTGLTQGRGRMDHTGQAPTTRKLIFLYPLVRRWRSQLCQESTALS